MTDSLYSQFTSHEAPIYEASQTPFENRSDLRQPYNTGEAKKKRDNAPDSGPKTGAAVEFWKFFTRQQTNNHVAMKINGMFNRTTLSDYAGDKARYISEYHNLLKSDNQ
jgi:hypothetical protein